MDLPTPASPTGPTQAQLGWSDTPQRKAIRNAAFQDCFHRPEPGALERWRGHELWASYQSESKGATTLMAAAMHPCPASLLLPFLLDEGVEVNAVDLRGRTALHGAPLGTREHRVGWVEALLAHGADPGVEDHQGLTPMAAALRSGNTRILAILIAHGATPSAADRDSAAQVNNGEVLDLFWDTFGAPPEDVRTRWFLQAANGGHWKRVGALMDRGVDIHARNQKGNIVLMACARTRPPVTLIQELVARGVDPTVVDDTGTDALGLLGRANAHNEKRRTRNLTKVGQAIAAGRQERLDEVLADAPPAPGRRGGRL